MDAGPTAEAEEAEGGVEFVHSIPVEFGCQTNENEDRVT
jgi:hypothetical protein